MAGERAAPRNEQELDDLLSEPSEAAIAALRAAPGHVVILGAGGKMGPTLARMVARAASRAGTPRKVIAVSRFSSATAMQSLEASGVTTLRADLLDPNAVSALPDAENVIFMAGQKFGTTDAPSRTWMMNVVVPALCARRYAGSRIVAFSTGNVYPLVPVRRGGGATEATPPAPIGEYAQSCLGRERVFEHAATTGTRVAILRLNYAIDLRYGVLTDLATQVLAGDEISLAMGHVNVIWQGDANRAAIELLPRASTPPLVLNVTGGETVSVRALAEGLAERMGKRPRFRDTEAPDALLSDTTRMRELLAPPSVPLPTMLDWAAEWVKGGRPLLGKPTHFQTRDGSF